MSKVKISGNASGTGVLTIEAPNTNTDRTITLPDTTGTLVDTTGATFTGGVTGTDVTLSGGLYVGGTGSANYLDDYEEGTWTPGFSASTTAPSGVNYTSERAGTYTKIGNMVYFTGVAKLSSVGTAGSGALWITGLPFVCNAPGGYYTGVSALNFELLSSGFTTANNIGLLPNGVNRITPYYNNWGTSGMVALQWSHTTTGTRIRVSGSYRI